MYRINVKKQGMKKSRKEKRRENREHVLMKNLIDEEEKVTEIEIEIEKEINVVDVRTTTRVDMTQEVIG